MIQNNSIYFNSHFIGLMCISNSYQLFDKHIKNIININDEIPLYYILNTCSKVDMILRIFKAIPESINFFHQNKYLQLYCPMNIDALDKLNLYITIDYQHSQGHFLEYFMNACIFNAQKNIKYLLEICEYDFSIIGSSIIIYIFYVKSFDFAMSIVKKYGFDKTIDEKLLNTHSDFLIDMICTSNDVKTFHYLTRFISEDKLHTIFTFKRILACNSKNILPYVIKYFKQDEVELLIGYNFYNAIPCIDILRIIIANFGSSFFPKYYETKYLETRIIKLIHVMSYNIQKIRKMMFPLCGIYYGGEKSLLLIPHVKNSFEMLSYY